MGNAPSKTTYLKVINNTSSNITTKVRDVDNYDWGSGCRPDHNFQNRVIKPHSQLTNQADINTAATANLFTLDLIFDDHTKITCRIDQGVAAGRKAHLVDYVPGAAGAIAAGRASGQPVAFAAGIGADAADAIYSNFHHGERGILGRTGGDNKRYTASLSVIENTVVVNVN